MDPDALPPRVTLCDIGRELGVSHATVSMALRGNPRVSAGMRARVVKVAEELGYRPDPALSALAYYRTQKKQTGIQSVIGWINAWPEPENLRQYKEFNGYWEGANAAAGKLCYRLEEFRFDRETTPMRLHQILSTRGIRGLLLPPHSAPPDFQAFPWEHYAVVRFGRSLSHPRTHLVTSDHIANTMLAFQKIRERGYERIGFVTNERNHMHKSRLFEAGYLISQRFVPKGQSVPLHLIDDTLPREQQQHALAAWLEKYRPDVLFSDLAGIRRLLEKVDRELSDGIALATTSILDGNVDSGIDQHPEEVGRVGVLMLHSLMMAHETGIPKIMRQVLVEGAWKDGKSLPGKLPGVPCLPAARLAS